MRTRLTTTLALALLVLGWASLMLAYGGDAVAATIRVVRHALN